MKARSSRLRARARSNVTGHAFLGDRGELIGDQMTGLEDVTARGEFFYTHTEMIEEED